MDNKVAPALIVIALLTLTAAAQNGVVTWKNFRSYPAGQYRNVATPYRDGRPAAAPTTTTVCTKALTPQQAAAMMSLGNSGSCTTRLFTDQPAIAAYEQSCPRGGATQVIRMTLRAIDARHLDVETRSTLDGQHEAVTRISSTYLGACPTNMAGPASSVPKPSPSECREIADMRRSIDAASNPCAEMPASYRPQCVAQMEAGRKMYAQLEQSCR